MIFMIGNYSIPRKGHLDSNPAYNSFTIVLRPDDNLRTGLRHSGDMNNTTASIRGGRLLARAALCAELLASVLTLHAGPPAKPASGELVVHECGTFTSLQAANGNPIAWHPFASSQLPGFVYDWT